MSTPNREKYATPEEAFEAIERLEVTFPNMVISVDCGKWIMSRMTKNAVACTTLANNLVQMCRDEKRKQLEATPQPEAGR
jgi:hypothetical protein